MLHAGDPIIPLQGAPHIENNSGLHYYTETYRARAFTHENIGRRKFHILCQMSCMM